MAPKNGPPDRWMDYSPMGERILGTRFICMKVPLKQGLSRKMEESDKFSCKQAVEMASRKGFVLGLVIDLSFTNRYYDPAMFEEQNVAHKKIFMPGRVLPKKEIIDSFSDAVAKFEDENDGNDHLIAVHCTHGLNRTGYMICRYLIDKKDFKPDDAIKAFEEARGHKMEREIYLNDLRGICDDNSEKHEGKYPLHRSGGHFSQDDRSDYDNDTYQPRPFMPISWRPRSFQRPLDAYCCQPTKSNWADSYGSQNSPCCWSPDCYHYKRNNTEGSDPHAYNNLRDYHRPQVDYQWSDYDANSYPRVENDSNLRRRQRDFYSDSHFDSRGKSALSPGYGRRYSPWYSSQRHQKQWRHGDGRREIELYHFANKADSSRTVDGRLRWK